MFVCMCALYEEAAAFLLWKDFFHDSNGGTGKIEHFSTLVSSAPQPVEMFAAMFDFALVNLAPSFCPFLSNPACDADFFSSTLFFFVLLSSLLFPLLRSLLFSSLLLPSPLVSLFSRVDPSLASLSSPLLLLCCVHIGSDSLQKGGLQPRHLTLGLQGQYEACSWWRECKYCLAHNQSSRASANQTNWTR